MDKLNKKLIKIKKKLVKIKKKQEKLEEKSQKLKKEIHLYFDSPKYNTRVAEEYVMNYFWQNATYSSRFYTSEIKQNYTKMMLSKIANKYAVNKKRALDVGCGNGMYTEHLASVFDECVGLDLSVKRIKENKKNNKFKNITYIADNFITCDTKKLGKYDFIFASDLGMYSDEKYHKKIFEALLNLLNDDGVLVTRESTTLKGSRENKSHHYIAYYRNKNYYKKRFYKKYFVKSYRDCSYNIPHLDKYFSVFENDEKKVEKNPFLLNKIVKNYVSKDTGSSHYYIYKKNIGEKK